MISPKVARLLTITTLIPHLRTQLSSMDNERTILWYNLTEEEREEFGELKKQQEAIKEAAEKLNYAELADVKVYY